MKTWAIASVMSSASVIRGGRPGPALGEEVVDQHVSCREKVVELGVHRGLRVDVAVATPDFGGLRAASSQPAGNLESII
jgi:hypothetical protein